jgi:hypothetical protein
MMKSHYYYSDLERYYPTINGQTDTLIQILGI